MNKLESFERRVNGGHYDDWGALDKEILLEIYKELRQLNQNVIQLIFKK